MDVDRYGLRTAVDGAPRIRVFLLEDNAMVRRAVRELLDCQRDMVVVGEAATVDEAFTRLPAAAPDVALLDRRLPDGDGIEVCRAIRADHPEVECIILTSYADHQSVHAAIIAGAAGLLLKQVRGTDIADAVRRAARGETVPT